MDLLISILLGAAAGYVATYLMGGKKNNWLVNILLGIGGSFVGGFLARILRLGGGLIVELAIAVGGACLVIWLVRKLGL